jgi:hypothetical protein
VGTSGISSGFPLLSRSSGQVAHVLLTRSPLGLPRCCHRLDLVRLACFKHAASVRPEPGSNSPSRSTNPCRKRPGPLDPESTSTRRTSREEAAGTEIRQCRSIAKGLLTVRNSYTIDSPGSSQGEAAESVARTRSHVLSSVFKEQSVGRHMLGGELWCQAQGYLRAEPALRGEASI